jgi:hypothetical protein
MTLEQYRRVLEVRAARRAGIKHPTNRELADEFGLPRYLISNAMNIGIKTYDWELRNGKTT